MITVLFDVSDILCFVVFITMSSIIKGKIVKNTQNSTVFVAGRNNFATAAFTTTI